MNTTREKSTRLNLHLHRRAFHHVAKVEPGMTVSCEQGLVWLTEANNAQDYTLRPGHSVVLLARGEVLIEALSDAELSIIHPN
ncbi:MAG: DUF2917 domain-containing protein [Chloroflexota bacterium]